MPDDERIIVRIAPDGAIHAETQGIKGPACVDYITLLEEVLEAITVSSAYTSEYAQTTTAEENEVRRDLHQW